VRIEIPQDICAFCKQPITKIQRPFKRLESGEKAHVTCYLDATEDEEVDKAKEDGPNS